MPLKDPVLRRDYDRKRNKKRSEYNAEYYRKWRSKHKGYYKKYAGLYKEQRKKYRKNNPKYGKKQSAYYKYWYKKNGRKRNSNYVENILKWQRENPEKRIAAVIAYRAVKKGLLVKPTGCQKCHVIEKLSGHHTDYTRPLDVMWLCYSCHKKIHLGLLD